ncbi:MAG TPA: ATPase, T2SS/T4P/T4SS family [Gemmatimonadaceae bacterium]|nr:ATPase, T2SS/T4P/T4SS family [Gemmatimonadaceae bacterium]
MAERSVRDDWLLPTFQTLLDVEQLTQLREGARESLWEAAVRRGLLTDDDILAALSARFRMPIADLMNVAPDAKTLVPESLARKYRVLPLRATDSALDIATADPHDLDCERTLGFATGRTIRMHLAAPTRISDRIDEIYRPENRVEKLLEGMTQYDVQSMVDLEEEDLDLSTSKASERPIIKLVDHIVAEGIQQRASDIHLESQDAGIVVIYRIDGVLRQAMVLPKAVGVPLVSRVKIMSGLDIADRLRPQDGRARVSVNGVRVDLRVSTLPASTGEKVVIRILDSRATVLSLDGLGLTPRELERMESLINLREGIILVTGPTGSGKTTTLYSALRTVQARGVNIVTVEDPVEYKLTGIVQVQVNEKAGLTFASALRSILRQDPDVVLVGEIRDHETASIATQASLTGHLVLSTLHTIDAASAVARLVDIGIEPFKIAAALKGVIAQRLVRRLCANCRTPFAGSLPAKLRRWIPTTDGLYKAAGCPECGNTGYRGRLAVTEIMIADAEVERRIAAADTTDQIAEAARDAGMRTTWESGVEQVLAGVTDVDELLRVLEVPAESGATQAPTTRPSAPAAPVGPLAPAPVPPSARVATPRTLPAFLPEDVLELVDDTSAGGARRFVRQTVLLVEDEEPLRHVLRDLLEREGYTVVEAGDGIQALDELDRSAPDAVVLDLNLPRLDGYGFLSHLRARAGTAHLPVLVLTARGDEDSEVRVFESGANDFITKPFRPRALSARLRALLKAR